MAQGAVSRRDWDDAHVIDAVLGIHADDPTLGYWFIADELADAGIIASENRVWRLCSTAGASPPTTVVGASPASPERLSMTTCSRASTRKAG